MHKIIFLVVFFGLFVRAYGQSDRLKFIIEAPDGSTAMTITGINKNALKLESSTDFYKYQLLDTRTSEAVLSGRNQGKYCIINISDLMPGTYSLRYYTENFIVTSRINLNRFLISTSSEETVAAAND